MSKWYNSTTANCCYAPSPWPMLKQFSRSYIRWNCSLYPSMTWGEKKVRAPTYFWQPGLRQLRLTTSPKRFWSHHTHSPLIWRAASSIQQEVADHQGIHWPAQWSGYCPPAPPPFLPPRWFALESPSTLQPSIMGCPGTATSSLGSQQMPVPWVAQGLHQEGERVKEKLINVEWTQLQGFQVLWIWGDPSPSFLRY